MAEIKLYINDWMYNAGILGLYRILSHNGDDIKYNSNCMEIEDDMLDDFGTKYFNYFIDKYEKFTSWYKIVDFESYIDNFNNQGLDEKELEFINSKIEYTKTKLKSASYTSAYEVIECGASFSKLVGKLSKISLKKGQSVDDIKPFVKEQLDNLTEIIELLNKKDVKRVIAAKNVIYDVIDKFIKDVSFLNSNNNKKDMYEQYNEYFVQGVNEYINFNKDKYKYQCFSCSRPISKLSKPASYDLTWLTKMGVDMTRKTSHFWNYNGDAFICPICNIVYSCIPAGFNMLRGSGLFVNDNSSIRKIIQSNNLSIEDNDKMDDLENKTYYNILQSMEQDNLDSSKYQIENIQVVKMEGKNETRPYSFNVLSREMLRVIKDNQSNLRSLIGVNIKLSKDDYLNLHNEVVKRLYNHSNMYSLLNKLIILRLDGKFKKDGIIRKVLEINNDFINMLKENEGGSKMSKKGILYTQDLGYQLRIKYEKRSAENKINGITYRLVNTLKTKNVNKFIENIINAYMYAGETIPTIFLDALKDEESFQTIGYAFILGLQGDSSKIQQIKSRYGEENKDEK